MIKNDNSSTDVLLTQLLSNDIVDDRRPSNIIAIVDLMFNQGGFN